MLRSLVFLVAIALMISACQADDHKYYYWVDDSCNKKEGFRGFLDEAFNMARRASYRLETKNVDMQTAFTAIFKKNIADSEQLSRSETYKKYHRNLPGTDTAYNIVQQTMASIANDWERIIIPKPAHLRIYCNENDRWKEHPRPTLNESHVWDPVNEMIARKNGLCTSSQAGILHTGQVRTEKGQEHRRSTMSLCKRAFQVNPLSLSALPADKDLSELSRGIQEIENTVPRTILHEFTHTIPYRTDDVSPAYGWKNVFNKTAPEAVLNADSYAILGLFALLQDTTPPQSQGGQGGYALPRYWAEKNKELEGYKAARRDAAAGKLRIYDNIVR